MRWAALRLRRCLVAVGIGGAEEGHVGRTTIALRRMFFFLSSIFVAFTESFEFPDEVEQWLDSLIDLEGDHVGTVLTM